jgi:hypothetical protein
VSCTAATLFCAGVGYSSPTAALGEQWNGSKWTIVPTLSTGAGALHPVLSGVSCTAANQCVASGAVQHLYCNPRPPNCKIVNGTLAMQWSGSSWTRLASVDPSPATASHLAAASCSAANTCMAVGASGSSTLAEAWDGTTWTIQSASVSGALSGVSCPATNRCTAVGSSGAATLAEAWNGTGWAAQSIPNPSGATSSALSGVSCASAVACLAVGQYTAGTGSDTALAESWTASGGWSITSPAIPAGATSSVLGGVSCTSATACVAVGHYVTASGAQKTLAEQWNGGVWTIQATPNPSGASQANLSGVSCSAAGACTAVGDYIDALGVDVTLAERYSGA